MHTQSNTDVWSTLLKIQRIAVSILEGSDAHYPKSPCPSPITFDEASITLDLTFPHDIIASIINTELPDKVCQDLVYCFTNQLNMLRARFLAIFRTTSSIARSHDDLAAIRRGVQDIYYKQCVPLCKLELSSRLAEATLHRAQNRPEKKSTFNNEYTPLLEKYFEHNAYPSAPDRLVLARKTMKTSRQIEVWFQNHRNRAKKEGRIIKRSSSDQVLELSLNSLQPDMPPFSISEQESLASSEGSSSEDGVAEDLVPRPTSSTHVFSCLAPRHAFPMHYPPNCADDPFPNENGIFRFAPPVWRRRPATRQLANTPVNLDEFVAMFASKLNFEETCYPNVHSRRKATNTSTTRKPWFAATVTIASPAPHPAFLPSCVSLSEPILTAPTSNSFSQSSLRSRSRSITSFCQIASSPRRLAPLPRRIPNTCSNTNHNSLLSLSQMSSSRTSSFSSTATSRSRSTSSSSLTDLTCSPPVIQPQIITNDIYTKLRPQCNDLGFMSVAPAKQVLPFSQYQSHILLAQS